MAATPVAADASKAQPMDTSTTGSKPAAAGPPGGGETKMEDDLKDIDRRANLIQDVKERDKFYLDQAELRRLKRVEAEQKKAMEELKIKQDAELRKHKEDEERRLRQYSTLLAHMLTHGGGGAQEVGDMDKDLMQSGGKIDLTKGYGQLIMASLKNVTGQQIRQADPHMAELDSRKALMREMFHSENKMQDDHYNHRPVEASRGGGGRDALLGEMDYASKLMDDVSRSGKLGWDGESTAPRRIIDSQMAEGSRKRPRYAAGLGLDA